MAFEVKCPKCGSTKVQLSDVSSKNGCLYMLLFGWWYVFWVAIKWIIGLAVLVCFDWWMAIIHKVMKKGYRWHWKRWFAGKRKMYYCHDCGHNFKG